MWYPPLTGRSLGPEGQAASSDVPLWQNVKMTLGNRTFRIYIASMTTYFFGLQFFLGGIAFMAADMMGLTDPLGQLSV